MPASTPRRWFFYRGTQYKPSVDIIKRVSCPRSPFRPRWEIARTTKHDPPLTSKSCFLSLHQIYYIG